jgi:putative ABC transport system ATP-binding protein
LQNIIDIAGVRKIYKMGNEKIVALDNITLSVDSGEFVCLLGTSGCGKSTLLNVMAGLEKTTKGTIIIKGYPVHKMNEKQLTQFRQKHIGFVFQSYNLLPTLTALENVTLPLIFKGLPRALRNKKAREALKSVGLGERLNHKPSEMSGGQQQRTSIARAFVGNPEIIFADEPTGNLDTKTTAEIMDLITSIARDNNQTLVIVTHDTEISTCADRIMYMRDGNIERIESMQKQLC